jgi:hypothetical protein
VQVYDAREVILKYENLTLDQKNKIRQKLFKPDLLLEEMLQKFPIKMP